MKETDCGIDDAPIVYPFVYQSRYYYYDYLTNYVYEFQKEEFAELQKVRKLGITEYLRLGKNLTLRRLINTGKINPPKIKHIEHQNINEAPFALEQCVNQIQLQVTKACNFICRYCVYTKASRVGRSHENSFMSWDIAKRSIDFLKLHSRSQPYLTIDFYGGEPLLNFEIIKQSVTYAESIFQTKQIEFILTTNGFLMNQKIADFLTAHNFKIIVSFDGPENIQNIHRPYVNGTGTYERVYQNLDYIRRKYPNFFAANIKINAVVFPDEEKENIYSYFETTWGIPKHLVNLMNADLRGIDYSVSSVHQLTASSDTTDLHYLYDDFDQNYKDFKRVYSDKRKIGENWLYRANCIPGVLRLFVDIDGNFFPCEKAPEFECCKIGNLSIGFDKAAVKRVMNIHDINPSKCYHCWAIRYCKMCICHCIDYVSKVVSPEVKSLSCIEIQKTTADFFKRMVRENG